MSADHDPAPANAANAATIAWLRVCLVACASVAVAAMLWHYPVAPWALASGLLAAALLVAWRPLMLWWLVPAALPVLDLAPWSGRLFFDEFDALMGLLLAVAWWRSPPAPRDMPDRLLQVALLAVALSYAVSIARALLPWPGIGPDTFANLLGPFNALRVARGAGWALLLWALARRQQAAGLDVREAFGHGLVLGLLGTVLFVLWERATFTQWNDFSDGYRVAGPFSAMHTGGAYVEAFLVCTLPFLLARLLPPAPRWRMAAGAMLLAASVYAVMVTFSRGGYAALALGLTLTMVLAARQHGQRATRLAIGVSLVALAASVATPVVLGSFAQSRLATVERDLVTRDAHWGQSLQMMGNDTATWLLGVGVGRFPAVNLLNSAPDARSASYRLTRESGQHFVRLGSGRALYLEQFVAVSTNERYRLQLRVRTMTPGASLSVMVCEKWLISSAACARALTPPTGAPGEWMTVDQWFASGAVGAAHSELSRPIKLSISLTGAGSVDLASIQLMAPDGRALVKNGDFADGMDHWFFTSDHHLAWHTKMLPLAVLFDQGLLGLLAMGGLFGLSLARAGTAAWRGDAIAAPWLAGLVSLTAVGAIDTLIDAPRFLMLWLLLCCFAANAGKSATSRTGSGR